MCALWTPTPPSDQHVRTTDDVTFDTLTITNALTFGTMTQVDTVIWGGAGVAAGIEQIFGLKANSAWGFTAPYDGRVIRAVYSKDVDTAFSAGNVQGHVYVSTTDNALTQYDSGDLISETVLTLNHQRLPMETVSIAFSAGDNIYVSLEADGAYNGAGIEWNCVLTLEYDVS